MPYFFESGAATPLLSPFEPHLPPCAASEAATQTTYTLFRICRSNMRPYRRSNVAFKTLHDVMIWVYCEIGFDYDRNIDMKYVYSEQDDAYYVIDASLGCDDRIKNINQFPADKIYARVAVEEVL